MVLQILANAGQVLESGARMIALFGASNFDQSQVSTIRAQGRVLHQPPATSLSEVLAVSYLNIWYRKW
jgi:hypothetical protein